MKIQSSSQRGLRKRMASDAEKMKSIIPAKAGQILRQRGQAARPPYPFSDQNTAEGCQWKVKRFNLILPSPRLIVVPQ
jgi:hypothetical protein